MGCSVSKNKPDKATKPELRQGTDCSPSRLQDSRFRRLRKQKTAGLRERLHILDIQKNFTNFLIILNYKVHLFLVLHLKNTHALFGIEQRTEFVIITITIITYYTSMAPLTTKTGLHKNVISDLILLPSTG